MWKHYVEHPQVRVDLDVKFQVVFKKTEKLPEPSLLGLKTGHGE